MFDRENPPGTLIDPKTLDFNHLRQEGIQHIERLAGKLWTDYNTHDPGITILEYLCFSLQDLNYRTTLPVEDITHDTDHKLPGPHEALHGSPVTINDLRKLVLDIEWVKDAWIIPVPKLAEAFPVNGRHQVLLEMETHEELGDLNSAIISMPLDEERAIEIEFPPWDAIDPRAFNVENAINSIVSITVNRGHVRVNPCKNEGDTGDDQREPCKRWEDVAETYRQMAGEEGEDESVVFRNCVEKYVNRVKKCHETRDHVIEKLQANRNLCEDFTGVKRVKIEEIGLTAGIEVQGDVNMLNLLREILYQVNRFISPQVVFHDAYKLVQQGIPVDKVFEGPALSNGILLGADLPARREAIYISDIIHLVMDCQGVKAVKHFEMANYLDGVLHKGGNQWCVPLSADTQYIPRLSPGKCNITFYKDGFRFTVPGKKIHEAAKLYIAAHRKWQPGRGEATTLPYPPGKKRDLDSYTSIQNDFPLNYGIGTEGLPSEATPTRKIQAGQLKGYLLVFEQLMANFLSQLGHARELLRMGKSSEKSFFYQLLSGVPNIEALYDREKVAQGMKEQGEIYYHRKNAFLDHLLARLGMNVSDHVMLSSEVKGDKPGDSMLADKLKLLSGCLALNANRFLAYDYMNTSELWDTGNVAGYKKRLCALLGIKESGRRLLSDLPSGTHEGFHLVEHILLVKGPHTNKQPGYGVRLRITGDELSYPNTRGEEDPYSYRITLVLPAWAGRFSEPAFRAYFEQTAHIESPAHIQIHCFWLDRDEMKKFEGVYKDWVEALGNPGTAPDVLSAKRDGLVEQLNLLYSPGKISAPGLTEDTGNYAKLTAHPGWEVVDIEGVSGHDWIIHKGNIILQTGYAGCNDQAQPGLGAVALYHKILDDTAEAIELTMTLDTHEYSEAGLVFLWKSYNDYWLCFYRNGQRKVVIAHVKDGRVHTVIENPTRDLQGKVITLRLSKEYGRVRIQQSSLETQGSEFLLNMPARSLSNTRFGLFTRYSNQTKFHRMELVDREVDSIIPVKHIDESGALVGSALPRPGPEDPGPPSSKEVQQEDPGKAMPGTGMEKSASPGKPSSKADIKENEPGPAQEESTPQEDLDEMERWRQKVMQQRTWPFGKQGGPWPDRGSLLQRLGAVKNIKRKK